MSEILEMAEAPADDHADHGGADHGGADHGGHDDPALGAEHAAVMGLVPVDEATHMAIKDGPWSDPATWEGGRVPGDGAFAHIPAGVTVAYDMVGHAELDRVRVDGTLDFATDQDTQLKVDTMVVAPEGRLTIGTHDAPVEAGVEAKIIFPDNGAIGWSAEDPKQFRHGLISHGSVEMHGAEKTGHVSVPVDARAGATSLTLAEAPDGWRVGDRIVLTGTEFTNSGFTDWKGTQDEVLTITRIDGATVHFAEPLRYNHLTPGGIDGGPDTRTAFVANLTRNIEISSERVDPDAEPAVHNRGHVMLMHSDDVTVENVGFVDLGRTDKSVPLDDFRTDYHADGTKKMVAVDPMEVDNPRGRYSLHIHRVGQDGEDGTAAVVKGSVVWGSPGWGFTVHDSKADLTDNVSFDVFGSHYVAETGNETGTWKGNIAIKAEGLRRTEQLNLYTDIHDLGQEGNGFWFNGRQVHVEDNVAAGMRSFGFAWLNRGLGMIPTPADQLEDPLEAMYRDEMPSYEVALQHVTNNQAFASLGGLQVIRRGLQQGHDVRTHIDHFDAWEVENGLYLDYTTNYLLESITLLADRDGWRDTPKTTDTNGVYLGKNVENMTFLDMLVDGFETGFLNSNSFVTAEIEERGNGIWWDHGHVFIDVTVLRALVKTMARLETGQVDGVDVPLELPPWWTPDYPFKDWISSDELVPGRLALRLDDASLAVRWGATAEERSLNITGTKIDSIGEVAFPVGNERIELGYIELLNVLHEVGYWSLLDGSHVTRLEVIYSDRATAESRTQAFLVAFPASWAPPESAMWNGFMELPPAEVHVPASLRDPANFAQMQRLPDGGLRYLGSELGDVMDGSDASDDAFDGRGGADFLTGVDGDDALLGGGGDDTALGGSGQDTLQGGGGHDLMVGGWGDDTLLGDDGQDQLVGEWGDDTLEGGAGGDLLSGGADDDTLLGGDGADTLRGGDGADILKGGIADDRLEGDHGIDQLHGEEGADLLLGGAGNDLLLGGDGIDAADGGEGADLIDGGSGDDVLRGGAGLAGDTLLGGAGADLLEGEGGNDLLQGGNGADTLLAGDGADTVAGDAGFDLLLGGDGADRLDGGLDDDRIEGGAGSDHLIGGAGLDLLLGGTENDNLSGGDGVDSLAGEGGADRLHGGLGDDILLGGGGSDDLWGDEGLDRLEGGEGADALWGGADADQLYGAAGADQLDGEAGDDALHGGTGDDRLDGGDGADRLDGGTGRDLLKGEAGDDLLIGGDDADTLQGGSGRDELLGGLGDDMLQGQDEDDRLQGGSGQDDLLGGDGADLLLGGEGADLLDGGNGADLLDGGAGIDALWGRGGIDSFVVGFVGSGHADTIRDYARGEVIDLSAVLGGYDPGRHDLDDWVRKTATATGYRLSIDGDGAEGPAGFVTAITVVGTAGLDRSLADLVADGIVIA